MARTAKGKAQQEHAKGDSAPGSAIPPELGATFRKGLALVQDNPATAVGVFLTVALGILLIFA